MKKLPNKTFSLGIDWEDFGLTAYDYKFTNEHHKSPFIQEHNFLLQLLDELNIKCTFFVNGRTASLYKNLVKDIFNLGHSIGSHGFKHVQRSTISDNDFLEDSILSKNLIEDIIQYPVEGYRSPYLSISKENYIENLNILKKAGYTYDSSISSHKLKSLFLENNSISKLSLPIKVFPLCSFKSKPISLNLAGGSTWRVLPSFLTCSILKSNLTTNNSSLYLHPYEFGPIINPFRIICKSKKIKALYLYLRWNFNRSSIEKILRNLASSSNVNVLPIGHNLL